jgi:hypothetical protein
MSSSVLGELSEFLSTIREDFGSEISSIPSIDIRVIAIEIDETQEENDRCVAIVRNIDNGIHAQPYQCTRRKRFGDFCGLHSSKQTNFTAVHQYRKEKRRVYKICMDRLERV